MQPLGARKTVGWCQAGCTGVCQNTQNLADRDGTRARWWHAANLHVFAGGGVDIAEWYSFFGLIGGEVGQAELAWMGRVFLNRVDYGLRQLAFMHGARSFRCDAPEHCRQFRVFEPVAHRPGPAMAIVEVGPRDWILFQVNFGRQQGVEPGADSKTIFGQRDGGFEQLCPAQPAVPAMCHLQHGQNTGCTHRAAPDCGLEIS